MTQWSPNPGLPAKCHILTHDHGSRDARLCRNDRIFPNPYVMCHMDQVVQFRACTDLRTVQRATIYSGIRSDFDLVVDLHAAHLRELPSLSALGNETKAVCTEYGAGVNDHVIPYANA